MNFAYISLLSTVIIALSCKNQRILLGFIILTHILALVLGIVSLKGTLALAVFALIVFLFSNTYIKNKIAKTFLFFTIVVMSSLLLFHMIPGFLNILAIHQAKLSDLSCSFSMYLNFDKVMTALIIYTFTGLHKIESNSMITQWKQIFISFLISALGIISCGYVVGYIKFDPKLPYFLTLWMINNFFFVCFAEEVIFRGFIQRNLQIALNPYCKTPFLSLFVVSLLFGITHFKGGAEYVLLAFISSLFYGYVYLITNRIVCAMVVHFGVNLCHILLFTYPALIGVC